MYSYVFRLTHLPGVVLCVLCLPNIFSDTSNATLASTDILAEALVDENGTWTIQVIYPDDADPNSQLLTGEDALITVEDLAAVTTVNEEHSDTNSQPIYFAQGTRLSQMNVLSEESYACTKCDKIYNARRNLVRHINSECGKEPKYSCMYCEYRNYRRNEIINHIKKKHKKHNEKYIQLC